MGIKPWSAPDTVKQMLESVYDKHHAERLANLKVAVMFDDSKPFLKNKMNLGKVVKVRDLDKPHMRSPLDFYIVACSDLWHSVLNDEQREAYIDLHLTRLVPEYIPVTVVVNKKKKTVKDQWGRVEYTTDLKLDANGETIWRVNPIDLYTSAANARKYGLWLDFAEEFVRDCVHMVDDKIKKDHNAACNILDEGLRIRTVGITGIAACPDVRPALSGLLAGAEAPPL